MRERRIGGWMLTVAVLSAVLLRAAPASEVAFTDEFEGPELASGWQVVHQNPSAYSLSTRPGFLRIQTERGTLGEESVVNNLFLRDASGSFILETLLEFDPRAGQQFAGLLVYADDENVAALGLTYASGERGVFRGVVLLGAEDGALGTQRPGARYDETNTANPNSVYLRLLRSGNTFVAGFSEDGETFTDIGSIEVALPEEIRVGLGAANGDFEGCGIDCDTSIPADFDFFQFSTIDASPGDGQPDVPIVESVTISGPDEVDSGSTTEYAATALFSDGESEDVTEQATWTVAPPELGEVDAGVLTAATIGTTRQATLVVEYTQLTSAGLETTVTGSTVIRIIAPSTDGGGGGTRLCGAGLGFLGLALIVPFAARWRPSVGAGRKRSGPEGR